MSDSIHTQTMLVNGLNGAVAHIKFCEKLLDVSIVIDYGKYDFCFEPDTLKMFAYAYKLHCEECEKRGQIETTE